MHEYGDTATATVYGLETPSPSLRGDTGVFGVGLGMRPGTTVPLILALGVDGYTGEETGVEGTLRMVYRF